MVQNIVNSLRILTNFRQQSTWANPQQHTT